MGVWPESRSVYVSKTAVVTGGGSGLGDPNKPIKPLAIIPSDLRIVTGTTKSISVLARKGDVLFWHANLVHGGSPRANMQRSRRAVVCHYFAEGCVCYHDLGASPSAVHGPVENFPICGATSH